MQKSNKKVNSFNCSIESTYLDKSIRVVDEIKFAIIIPVYNTEKYLSECLNSILAQTYKNFVAFIIDDGSTDSSSRIVDEYSKLDSRIRVIHTKNKGVSSARNRALDMIEEDGKFDYILFLDSDDRWVPQCLEIVKTHLISRVDAVLVFGVQFFDRKGIYSDKVKKMHNPLFFEGNQALDFAFDNYNLKYTVSPAATLFIGNVVVPYAKTLGLRFDTDLEIGEDQKYKMEALMRANGLIVISDLLLQYRLRRTSLSHSERYYVINERLFISLSKLVSDKSIGTIRAMERRIADAWWNGLRYSAQEGTLDDHWKDFSYAYKFMKVRFRTGLLKTFNFKKRIIIFTLGKHFAKIYFKLNRKDMHMAEMSSYFD